LKLLLTSAGIESPSSEDALPVPGYAIDDQTAVRAVGGAVDVVSEGRRKLFSQSCELSDRGRDVRSTGERSPARGAHERRR
jgi:hypothetical protein